MEEREVCVKEAARPASVEDLPLSHEIETKDSTLEKQKETEEKRRKEEDTGTIKETVTECGDKYELKITEEVDHFVEVSSIKYNEPEGSHNLYMSKPEKLRTTESKQAPKSTTMKKNLEPKSVGPLRDEDVAPWNGITLNRCLVVAAVAALLSMGFQVLQDAVDSDDDLTEVEGEVWTPLNPNDQLPEPWFFEGWFGSSKPELPSIEEPESNDIEEPKVLVIEEPEPPAVEERELDSVEKDEPEPWFFQGWFGSSKPELPAIEEPESPDIEEPEVLVIEEPEPPAIEEPELPSVEKDEVKETQANVLIQESQESEKEKEKKYKQKPTEQWGLKAKGKYMEVKAAKIRRAPKDGFQKREIFPFTKKIKESNKSSPEVKEKSYKEKRYQKKNDDRKFDHPKKQEFGKSFKKEMGEQNKYFKQDKRRREDNEKKIYKQYHQEKDYKRKQDATRHR